MNGDEMLNQVGETYSLYTIPWDVLQSCGDSYQVTQNFILRSDVEGGVQLINADNVVLQPQLEIVKSNDGCDNNNEYNAVDKENEALLVYPNEQKAKARPKRKRPPIGVIACVHCDKTFTRLFQYRAHMQEHRNAKRFKCADCPESFNIEQNYRVHAATHSKGEPKCPICGRMFQRMASLKSHLALHRVDETYVCNSSDCLAEFDKEEDLNIHMLSHVKSIPEYDEEVPHVCSYCNYVFDDIDKYKEHVLLHLKAKKLVGNSRKFRRRNTCTTKEYPHKCTHCKKSFPKQCLLERHVRIHTGEKPFVCEICKKGFNQNGTLQIHLNKHKGKKPYECMFCNAKFSQKGNLRVHMEKTHTTSSPGEKLYKCSHCTCIFRKVSTLNGHVTKMHSTRSDDAHSEIDAVMDQLKELNRQTGAAKAPTLDKSVTPPPTNNESLIKIADSSVDGSIRRYMIRQRRYGDSRWYVCSTCGKEFKKPSDLIRHMRIHTREKPFKCKECGQQFSQKSTLRNHATTHTRQLDYSCTICSKSFPSQRILNVHQKKHDERKLYKCIVCHKSISLEEATAHLAEHGVDGTAQTVVMKEPLIETDTGVFPLAAPKPRIPCITMDQYKNRPYKCHLCTAAFLKSVHLKRHLLMHSGKKEYKCEVCGKLFLQKYALKEHMKYHSQIKDHECRYCKKRFYTNSILQRHMLQHSSVKPFICPYCKKRFKQPQLCRRHIRQTHRKLANESVLAISDGGTSHLNSTKMLDLSETLGETNFGNMEVTDGNISVLLPQESYGDISVVADGRKGQDVMENHADKMIGKGQKSVHGKMQIPALELEILPEQQQNDSVVESTKETGLNFSTIYITTDDLHLLGNSNIVGSLLPQIKLQNTDPLLLNSMNDLQEANNLVAAADPSVISHPEPAYQVDAQTYDSFNPNLIFNSTINFEKDLVEEVKSEVVPSNENLIIVDSTNKNPELGGYFNITFPPNDYVDINSLNLPPNASIGKILRPDIAEEGVVCTKCKTIYTLDDGTDKHVCARGEEDGYLLGMEEEEARDVDEVEAKREQVDCRYCGKVLPSSSALVRHVSTKHKETVDNSCKFCQKTFKKRSDLERHVRTHTGERPFACDKCEKSFTLKSTLMSHYRTHNPYVKEFMCQVCNAYFSCRSSLKKHTQLHTDIKPFSCELCHKKFRTLHHKKGHMAWHEKQAKSKAPVKINQVKLLESIAMETNNEIQGLCDQGNVENGVLYEEELEPQPDELQQTSNLIATDLPIGDLNETMHRFDPILLQLQPNYSTTTTTTIGGLQLEIDPNLLTLKHDLVEADVPAAAKNKKPPERHQCDVCLKFYTTKAILKKHARMLHGDFKCDKCPKAFDSKELLEKHGRLHLGYRPHACMLCANSFLEESSLKVHLKRMHNITDRTNIII